MTGFQKIKNKKVWIRLTNLLYAFRYRVALPVEFIQKNLAFDKTSDWTKFIEPFDLQFTDKTRTSLDCKASMASLPSIQ